MCQHVPVGKSSHEHLRCKVFLPKDYGGVLWKDPVHRELTVEAVYIYIYTYILYIYIQYIYLFILEVETVAPLNNESWRKGKMPATKLGGQRWE